MGYGEYKKTTGYGYSTSTIFYGNLEGSQQQDSKRNTWPLDSKVDCTFSTIFTSQNDVYNCMGNPQCKELLKTVSVFCGSSGENVTSLFPKA